MLIGILGGGQLGRMMAQAGMPLGHRFRVFDPAEGVCAGQVAEHHRASFDDAQALERFCAGLEAATYEWENVPLAAARRVASLVPRFAPGVAALEVAQDRLDQKNFLNRVGLPTAPFAAVGSEAELRAAVARLGLPAVLKTRRMGYDGKGQAVLRSEADVAGAWAALGKAPLILEAFVPFEREVSVVAARGRDGAIACYPVGANEHREGILRVTVAPAAPSTKLPRLQDEAERMARAVLGKLDYVGVLTLELFEHDGRLLVNELATRVHNSGHWTIDGARTSQFENHVRAVAGMPLGSAALKAGPYAMLNLVGVEVSPSAVAEVPGAHLNLYGKAVAPGRKVGHVNVPLESLELLRRTLAL